MTTSVTTSRRGRSSVYGNMTGGGRRGFSRVRNDIAGYDVYVSYDATLPLAGSIIHFASLPAAITLTPPGSGTRTYHVLVTAKNQFGIRSANLWAYDITVNAAGAAVISPLLAPDSLTLNPAKGGYVNVRARYPNYDSDEYKATSWRFWVGTSPPDPLVDLPTSWTPVTGGVLPSFRIGPNSPGTYHVAVALFRDSDSSQSPAVIGTVILPDLPTPVIRVHAHDIP